MREKIIINFPTNIGDTALSLPVLDRIKADYPYGRIIAIASPQTKNLLLRNNFVDEVVVFNKLWRVREKIRFVLSLRGKCDVIVDLKNSVLPLIIRGEKRTPFYRKLPKNIHAKDKFLKIIEKIISKRGALSSEFILNEGEKNKWENLNLRNSIFIACSSSSSLKCYPYRYLRRVAESLLAKNYHLVVLGQEQDKDLYKDIINLRGVLNLAGKTQISDAAYLLKNYASLLLCVDSSLLHLGSYLNIPIVAIFGPTDPKRYGPWSERYVVVQNKEAPCIACQKPTCAANGECMKINHEVVVRAVTQMAAASRRR